ncbi:MAG: hypothetical protein HY716_05625 [Planctomycetes bacterium]|nr:hypothetical protein [Planctomycetota bacterium]
MRCRTRRHLALSLGSALLSGCTANPENDPVITVLTVAGYVLFFGFFGFLLAQAIWGPEGP